MGLVECITFAGVKLWFYSNDHHPPHFHMKKSGEWDYRVFFLEPVETMFEKCAGSKKMKPKFQQAVFNAVAQNREKLLREWETKVCVKEINEGEV